MTIHPQAIVSPDAQLGESVTIGPFCIVEPHAVIGDHCTLVARAVVKNGTTLGSHNLICEGAVLGGNPQHTRMPEKLGRVLIGSHNTIRENCTIHRALNEGSVTRVGDHNLLMVGTHVAHDCTVGNNIVFANNALLGGFVTIGDRAFVSGAVAVHQFCRIGQMAMVGGCARVVQDVPPYVTVDGHTGMIVGLNLVGLRRNGFGPQEIAQLKAAYRVIYRRSLRWTDVLEQLKKEFSTGPAADFHPFLSQGTRGFVQERRMPPGATLKLRRASDDDHHEDRRLSA
ncbi:MAG TPA: acyl-ACP--UDP-N-acetylglucosamine O-acyltransferase [Pirellulales bacterium]|nr:acyl-ACP--UDP-N-acetylglucosamine O-acyltransferase [Pirellulales bacterium]